MDCLVNSLYFRLKSNLYNVSYRGTLKNLDVILDIIYLFSFRNDLDIFFYH